MEGSTLYMLLQCVPNTFKYRDIRVNLQEGQYIYIIFRLLNWIKYYGIVKRLRGVI